MLATLAVEMQFAKVCQFYYRVSLSQLALSGDSGSGLAFPLMKNNEEIFTLRGVVSNARQIEGECDLSFYTMFTNLDHYVRFIKSAEKRFPST